MRSQNLPHGKFYTILSQTGISQQYATTDACLPKAARGHMVLVLGWADRWNWVKVVCVSIFLTLSVQCKSVTFFFYGQIISSAVFILQYIDYLPIYPSKKNQHSGIQLKLCNGWDAWTYTEKKSYVKMDQVYEIPVESLTAAGANGRQYELQSKSWDKVQDFLRKMNVHAIHDRPVAPESVNIPTGEGFSSQALGAGVASDAGKYSSHMPVFWESSDTV